MTENDAFHAYCVLMLEEHARETFEASLTRLTDRLDRLASVLREEHARNLPRVRDAQPGEDTWATIDALTIATRAQHDVLWALANLNMEDLAAYGAALDRARAERAQVESDLPTEMGAARDQLAARRAAKAARTAN